jgi:hypothetical protein
MQYVLYFQVWRKLKVDINAGRISADDGIEEMRAFLSKGAHLDGDPGKPMIYPLFHDTFRPPNLYYVDELDRLLGASL